jgi:anaerobic ribonucleoside-triphosphate reductase
MVKDKVIKRDGSLVEFDKDKIKSAISNAFVEVDGILDDKSNEIINRISDSIEGLNKELTVENIQDIVENKLMESKRKDVAKTYMIYRNKRALEREGELSTLFDKMKSILLEGDNENSNKDYTLQSVKRDTIAGEFFRYDLKNQFPKVVYEAHKNCELWLHDGDVQSNLTNCCLVNVEDMLENGTRITNADIEQPNSIQTAMNIATQIMASVSANQFGGVSINNFNEIFSKYAKKNFIKNFETIYNTKFRRHLFKIPNNISSDMKLGWFKKLIYGSSLKFALTNTDKQIYDSCQLYEYQTSSVLGSASQSPFSTITFNIPTSWESERIVMNYLKVRQKGLGKNGTIALFPKLSMIVVDGYNLKESDPYYYILEEASKCIAKTYYPDILNYSKEDYDDGKYYGRMGEHISPSVLTVC